METNQIKNLNFKKSSSLSIGVELEFQLVDPITYDLANQAKNIMRKVKKSNFSLKIKPEITQSMIEINSSVHRNIYSLANEFEQIKNYFLTLMRELPVYFSGGGTHPFQLWNDRKIFPSTRFKKISKLYGSLIKQDTIFGQHVHIGCANVKDAIYLTHALARFVPQLIALSASSPFYQGIDTGYHSVRSSFVNSAPTAGIMPTEIKNWAGFLEYFEHLREAGIVESMKDIYWDIRPKPEFGTVEIRVCDTPLTFTTAIMLAAYIQMLCDYLLKERPKKIIADNRAIYAYNRFQASRYGFDGNIIDFITLRKTTIQNDILQTLDLLIGYNDHSKHKNTPLLAHLKHLASKKLNDANYLRKFYQRCGNLQKTVQHQCKLWTQEIHLP